MNLPRLALGLGLLVLLTAGPAWAQPDPMEDYRTGQKLLDQWTGQQDLLDRAEKIFTSLLTTSPGSAAAYTGLGRLACKKGYLRCDSYNPEALTKAQGLKTIKPDFQEAGNLLDRIDQMEKELKEE